MTTTPSSSAAAAPDPLRLRLVSGDDEAAGAHLEVLDVAEAGTSDEPSRDLDRLLLDKLAGADGPLSRTQLRAELRVRNERLGQALVRLAAAGALVRQGDRWTVPVPSP